MKKVILLVCGLFVAVATQAQDKKMWLSGTMGINSTTPDADGDTKISTMTFGPQFGYMVNENIAVGLTLSLSSTKTKDFAENLGDIDGDGFDDFASVGEATDAQTIIAPFVRYYKSLGDNFSLYGEFNLAFGSGKTSISDVEVGGVAIDDPDDVKFSTLNIGVGPGIQYWFNDNWSMNAYAGILGYSSRNDKDGTIDSNGDVADLKSNSIDLNLDFSALSFALNYHF